MDRPSLFTGGSADEPGHPLLGPRGPSCHRSRIRSPDRSGPGRSTDRRSHRARSHRLEPEGSCRPVRHSRVPAPGGPFGRDGAPPVFASDRRLDASDRWCRGPHQLAHFSLSGGRRAPSRRCAGRPSDPGLSGAGGRAGGELDLQVTGVRGHRDVRRPLPAVPVDDSFAPRAPGKSLGEDPFGSSSAWG